MNGTLTRIPGPRHQRRLRIHVRDRNRVAQVQGLDGDQTTQAGQPGAEGGDRTVAWRPAKDEGSMRGDMNYVHVV